MSSENEQAAPPSKAGGLNHRLVLHAIRRKPLLSAAVVALAACTGAAVWLFLPLPKVTAAVVLQVATQRPRLVPGGVDGDAPFASYRLSQSSLVKSNATLSATLKQPGVRDLGVIQTATPDPLSWLDRKLVVDAKSGTTEFMRVTIEGDEQEELLAVLHALAKAYLAQVDERDDGAQKGKLKQLEKTQQGYRAAVNEYHKQLDNVAVSLGASDSAQLLTLDGMRNDDLRRAVADLSSAEQDSSDWRSSDWSRGMRRTRPSREPPVVVPEMAIETALKNEPKWQELERAVDQAEKKLEMAKNDFGEGSLVRTRAQVKVEEAKADLDKYSAKQRPMIEARLREAAQPFEKSRREDLETHIAALQNRVRLATERRNAAQVAIAKSNTHRIEFEKVKRDIEQTEKLSSSMIQEIERLKVELDAPPRVDAGGTARPPRRPE